MPPNSDRVLEAIQHGAESVLPEGITTSIKVTANLPQALSDLQEAIKNAEEITSYATVTFQSAMAFGNTGLAVGGGGILLISGKNYFEAKNNAAKVFYILSMLCSGTGTVSSAAAVYCDKCGLSKTGMLGDGFGGLFLKAGDYMNQMGEKMEGKRGRFKNNIFRKKNKMPRRPITRTGSGYKGLSFVPAGCYSTGSFQELMYALPYEKIILVGTMVLSVYTYGKFIVSVYKYFDSKFSPKQNYSEQIHYTAKFLAYWFYKNRVYKIYYAALQ